MYVVPLPLITCTTYKTVVYKLTEGLTEAHFEFRVDWASPEFRVDWTSPEFRVDWTSPEFKVEFRVKRASPECRVDWASPELGLIRELIGHHLSAVLIGLYLNGTPKGGQGCLVSLLSGLSGLSLIHI